MAQLFPDISTIKRLHQKPTAGELFILNFLQNNLDQNFEIYFQPFVNGDRPDIVVLKKNGGAIIIEVKDWFLSNYYIDENADWLLKKNDVPIKSPLSQVKYYKDNLFKLHLDTLLYKSLKYSYYHAIINTMVYFHNATEHDIYDLILDRFDGDRYSKYRKFVQYIECWGKDSLNPERLNLYIQKIRLDRPSRLFDNVLYQSFKRYLQPPYHSKEEGIPINYTKAQELLIVSEEKQRRKIKGLAGCGKTLVLAKRAVNAHLRTKSRVLILTYNLSLKNYIHDRINDVREEFQWDKFYLTNYHQFIKSEANNYGLPIISLNPFDNVNFFEPVKHDIPKFDVILIDEIQDYKTSWLEIITKYFLKENGEFIVFGDEKQNIYNRPLDDNNQIIVRTIPGRWNESLNISKRFANEIGRIALKYQKTFLSKKYSIDELQIIENPTFEFEKKIIRYIDLRLNASPTKVFNIYKAIIKEFNIHPSDIGLLSSKYEYLRELDFLIRTRLKEVTKTTFETKEEYEELKGKHQNGELFHDVIEDIRRSKKNHFWMKTGTTKLSSIHSFKGWEVHTLFLLIEPEETDKSQFETVELIYTGLTRAQLNLFVINLGNTYYDKFFRENIDVLKIKDIKIEEDSPEKTESENEDIPFEDIPFPSIDDMPH